MDKVLRFFLGFLLMLGLAVGDVPDGVDVRNVGTIFFVDKDFAILRIGLDVDFVKSDFVRARVTPDGE